MTEIVEDMTMSRLLLDLIPIASSAMGEEEVMAGFSKSMSSIFGIEDVALNRMKGKNGNSQLEDYLINTKKPYIDNQLSAYSAFPEFIEFKNIGFKSCAMLPLVADGKVYSILRLLSKSESKFSEGMLRNLSFGASIISFVLTYKSERGKNIRLATYFDASFNSPMPQFLIASDGNVVKCNKSAAKEFGVYNTAAKQSKNIFGVEYKQLVSATAPKVLIGGQNNNRIYSISVQKVNEHLVHVIADDITEKYAYYALNSAIGAGRENCLVLLDTAFTIKEMSDNSEHVFGYSKNVFLNGNFADLVSSTQQEEFKKLVFGLGPEGGAYGGAELALGDAGQRFMRYCIKRMPNGFIMMVTRADYEKDVAEMKKDLNAFIESSSEIVIGLDEMGHIRTCNMSIEQILGYRKDEIIGTDIKMLYAEHDVLDRDLNYVKKGGKIDNSFFNLISKGFEKVPATHSIRMMNAVDDESPRYLLVIKELGTKKKLANQDAVLRKQESQITRLAAEGQLKSQFIYNISHELKTPLTNIKGYSKLMYDGEFGSVSDGQRDALGVMLKETDRLVLVIQQVLDAAKLEQESKVKLDYKQVDLKAMKENATIKSLEEGARSKGLSFEWKVAFDVPEIAVDPNRLIQVIVNLVGNATKFTDKGGIIMNITRDKRKVKFEIIDTGIGISEDDRKMLFKRKFFEAAKRGLVQQPGAGTGLGLSIANDIIKLHGGTITVESVVGKGSNFWFTIPIKQKQRRKKLQGQSHDHEQK